MCSKVGRRVHWCRMFALQTYGNRCKALLAPYVPNAILAISSVKLTEVTWNFHNFSNDFQPNCYQDMWIVWPTIPNSDICVSTTANPDNQNIYHFNWKVWALASLCMTLQLRRADLSKHCSLICTAGKYVHTRCVCVFVCTCTFVCVCVCVPLAIGPLTKGVKLKIGLPYDAAIPRLGIIPKTGKISSKRIYAHC